jgi:hypothetical protein
VRKLAAYATSKMPCASRVAALAHRKVIAAERSLAVVARHAALSLTRRVMVERLRCGDLSALRHAGPNLMASVTGNALMFEVIKADAEGRG